MRPKEHCPVRVQQKGKTRLLLKLNSQKMANLFSYNAALAYKQSSLSVQMVDGKKLIDTEVCPQVGDTILDLGCGTGELSAYLAELAGPEGKVVAVDPDKKRLLLAQQSYRDVKNLSFVEGNASNFPGIDSESYDIIFCNYVIHWIPDKQDLFNNMFEGLKHGGKIAIQYVDYICPFVSSAFKELNPENAERIYKMFQCEERPRLSNIVPPPDFASLRVTTRVAHSRFSKPLTAFLIGFGRQHMVLLILSL